MAAFSTLGATVDAGGPTALPARPETHFQVEGDPHFGSPRALLRRFLLDSHASGATPQHFCVLGRELANRDRTALIFWREGNKLILWEGQQPPWRLFLSRRLWDLRRDVVDTPREVNGSSYLLTRDWVEEMRHACALEGESLTVAAAEHPQRKNPVRPE